MSCVCLYASMFKFKRCLAQLFAKIEQAYSFSLISVNEVGNGTSNAKCSLVSLNSSSSSKHTLFCKNVNRNAFEWRNMFLGTFVSGHGALKSILMLFKSLQGVFWAILNEFGPVVCGSWGALGSYGEVQN